MNCANGRKSYPSLWRPVWERAFPRQTGRRLGIQRSGINRLESGTQNPTLDMILKIASALGKDVSLELNDKEGAYEQCLQSPHL